VQDVDQKMDVVLRLLNAQNTPPPVAVPPSEASLASHLEEEEERRRRRRFTKQGFGIGG